MLHCQYIIKQNLTQNSDLILKECTVYYVMFLYVPFMFTVSNVIFHPLCSFHLFSTTNGNYCIENLKRRKVAFCNFQNATFAYINLNTMHTILCFVNKRVTNQIQNLCWYKYGKVSLVRMGRCSKKELRRTLKWSGSMSKIGWMPNDHHSLRTSFQNTLKFGVSKTPFKTRKYIARNCI